MSERWKPEEGDQYWVIAFNKVLRSEWRADSADLSRWQMGNCFKTEAEAQSAAEKVKALLLSLPDNGNNLASNSPDKQLPKLTAEVFNRPDCPEWARYAAVDKYEKAMWYEDEPKALGGVFWNSKRGQIKEIPGKWDASDWQNSLIKRPAKLPGWCKVGEWVWLDPGKILGSTGYKKVKSTVGLGLNFTDGSCVYFSDRIKQARLRPYNAEEMKALVGKPITMLDGAVCLCTVYSKRYKSVILDSIHWDAQALLNSGYTIDNKPCGKFEHLEDGEWVK